MYRKNAWEKYNGKELELLFSFNEDYKKYISLGKTERRCVDLSLQEAKERGFKDISSYSSLK